MLIVQLVYGDSAFEECENLTQTLFRGKNLEYIGFDSFAHCSSLKKVDLTKNTKSISIDGGAFRNCEKIEQVYLPSNFYFIANDAFLDSNRIIIIATEGSKAEQYAKTNNIPYFKKMSNSSVAAPIGNQFVFEGIRYEVKSKQKSIVKAIKYYGTGTGIKKINNVKDYNKHYYTVDEISENVFRYSSISGIDLSVNGGKNVKTIKDEFYGCYNLKEVYLTKNVKNIIEDAFKYCSNLEIIYGEGSVVESLADRLGVSMKPLPNKNYANDTNAPTKISLDKKYIKIMQHTSIKNIKLVLEYLFLLAIHFLLKYIQYLNN